MGNGRATAVLLARQGVVVYGTDLLLENAQVTQEAIANEGGRAYVAAYDSTCALDVERIVNDCMARFGCTDILLNNVGLSQPGDPVQMHEEVWDEQFQVNLKGAFLTCKHVLPIMKAQGGGSVINTSSAAGLRYLGKPQVAYSEAEAALMQFTKTTAIIHAVEGIRLNYVVPGLMHTPLIEGLAQKYAAGDTAGFVAHHNGQVLMQRMSDGWDTAHAVLFLAADESRYITATSPRQKSSSMAGS